MSNLDRFDSHIEDDVAECANCGASRVYSDLIFDEYAENFYCDDSQCFDEWASDNAEVVNGFYFEINCGGG